MTFYRGSLSKFLQFLGKRSDDPMTEVSKQDVVVFGNSLITQVSAKTANRDLKGNRRKLGFEIRIFVGEATLPKHPEIRRMPD
jgi:hypothetical protein